MIVFIFANICQIDECISCGSENFELYTDSACMNLTVYRCKICGLYTIGRSETELRNKAEEIYKKEY